MSYNVTIKTIPERYAATVHMALPRYEDEGMIRCGFFVQKHGRWHERKKADPVKMHVP